MPKNNLISDLFQVLPWTVGAVMLVGAVVLRVCTRLATGIRLTFGRACVVMFTSTLINTAMLLLCCWCMLPERQHGDSASTTVLFSLLVTALPAFVVHLIVIKTMLRIRWAKAFDISVLMWVCAAALTVVTAIAARAVRRFG